MWLCQNLWIEKWHESLIFSSIIVNIFTFLLIYQDMTWVWPHTKCKVQMYVFITQQIKSYLICLHPVFLLTASLECCHLTIFRLLFLGDLMMEETQPYTTRKQHIGWGRQRGSHMSQLFPLNQVHCWTLGFLQKSAICKGLNKQQKRKTPILVFINYCI